MVTSKYATRLGVMSTINDRPQSDNTVGATKGRNVLPFEVLLVDSLLRQVLHVLETRPTLELLSEIGDEMEHCDRRELSLVIREFSSAVSFS